MQHCKNENYKIKRYGQVFSGEMVGDLLVSMLPQLSSVQTIVDPMVGQGDLLRAATIKYPEAKTILGIDIDKDVFLDHPILLNVKCVLLGFPSILFHLEVLLRDYF